MKLKGLGRRSYNILFHTHTVAGIVIAFALYVIFLAGGFALFKEEMYRWENPEARYSLPSTIDFDRALAAVQDQIPHFQSDDVVTIKVPSRENPDFIFYGNVQLDTLTTREVFHVNSSTFHVLTHNQAKSHLGETLYELHYFAQIPGVGLYLAGLVGLFFLFASITGTLIHWKNIFQLFYSFNIRGSLKQFWKDAHVTLSFIGLPFQIIYGLTGALLGLSMLLLIPSVYFLFGGSQQEVRAMLDPSFEISVSPEAPQSTNPQKINEVYEGFMQQSTLKSAKYIRLQNLGKSDALMSINVDDRKRMTGDGISVIRMNTGEIVAQHQPLNKSYSEAVYGILIKLHYATYGGILMKIIYFLLTLITCFSIISGILLWQSSRDNKQYSDRQKRFHRRFTHFCLAICLSLLPAIALFFIINSLVPLEWSGRISITNNMFFGSWLLLTLLGLLIYSFRKLHYFYIVLTMVIAFLIPICNGWTTGDWMWITWQKASYYVFAVDAFWLITGSIILWSLSRSLYSGKSAV